MSIIQGPTDADLQAHDCLERVDRVPGNPEMTAFKRAARLHQARWRADKCLPIGSEPMRPKPDKTPRPLGSRVELAAAKEGLSNFLGEPVRDAVRHRIASPEPHQTLNADRLYCDLLSSMPMCFNLFGWLHEDASGLNRAVRSLWPDAPGRARALRFEWSPGRLDPEYLGNRSAFDAAIELELPGGLGVIGVETKYHEHCMAEKRPSNDRLDRYREVTRESRVFKPGALDAILEKDLQQIWLDHLLALSMLQNESGKWKWAKFVLVHPERNVSFADAARRYRALLKDAQTFEAKTVESILDAGALPKVATEAFRRRYLW